MQSSDFVRHSYNYRPNWTPLGPITIMITKGGEEKVNRNLKFKTRDVFFTWVNLNDTVFSWVLLILRLKKTCFLSFLIKIAVAIEAESKICAKQGYQRFKEHVAMYIFFL